MIATKQPSDTSKKAREVAITINRYTKHPLGAKHPLGVFFHIFYFLAVFKMIFLC